MRSMRLLIFSLKTVILASLLVACAPSKEETQIVLPTNTAPIVTSTPIPAPEVISPSVTYLEINGNQIPLDGDSFMIPGVVNPWDRLGIKVVVRDDSPGSVKILNVEQPYIPNDDYTAEVRLSVHVPADLLTAELLVHLKGEDESQEYRILFEPSELWSPVIIVNDPTGLTGDISIEVELLDLNDEDVLEIIAVEQQFNYQSTGDKEIEEYISNNNLSPIEVEVVSDGNYRINFYSDWPGRFPLEITAVDSSGNTTNDRIPIEIYWADQPLSIRGVMVDGWNPGGTSTLTSEEFENVLDRLVLDNVNFVSINPIWYLAEPTSSEFIRCPPTWREGVPTTSLTDDQLADFINLAHSRGMGVMLKPMVFVSDWTWIGSIVPSNPQEWFQNYADQVLLPMAHLAAVHDVEMLSLFNDSSEQNRYQTIWIDLIDTVREIYSGKITLAETHFPQMYRTHQPLTFIDSIDLYGFQGYLPGSGYPSYPYIPGSMDPLVDDMEVNILQHFIAREHLIVSRGLTAVATEMGVINFDGASQDPANIWFLSDDRVMDNQEQVDYYEANLRVYSQIDWIEGLFVWSIVPSETIFYHDGVYTNDFRDLPVEDLLRIWFYDPDNHDQS